MVQAKVMLHKELGDVTILDVDGRGFRERVAASQRTSREWCFLAVRTSFCSCSRLRAYSGTTRLLTHPHRKPNGCSRTKPATLHIPVEALCS